MLNITRSANYQPRGELFVGEGRRRYSNLPAWVVVTLLFGSIPREQGMRRHARAPPQPHVVRR
jgi:hypothetical protein